MVHKVAPYIGGKERPKKEADGSRLGGGKFHKQGNLYGRLVLGSCKMSRSPSFHRILKLYIEALAGFSHVCCPECLITHCSLKPESLKSSDYERMVGRWCILRTGALRNFQMPTSSSQLGSCHLNDL